MIEAVQYVRDNQALMPDDKLVPVSDPIQLRGITNPHGILIGRWLHRPDISTILTNLVCQTFDHNDGLDKAIKLYHKHNNP